MTAARRAPVHVTARQVWCQVVSAITVISFGIFIKIKSIMAGTVYYSTNSYFPSPTPLLINSWFFSELRSADLGKCFFFPAQRFNHDWSRLSIWCMFLTQPPKYIWNLIFFITPPIHHINFFLLCSHFFTILWLPLLPPMSVRIGSNSISL